MKKKVCLLLVVVLLLSLLAACGQKDDKISDKPSESKTSSTQTEDKSSPSAGDTADASKTETGEVKPCRIVQPGLLSSDYDSGIAEINKRLKADGVDIEVEVKRIPWDAYAEKLNLMLTTGEEFELLHIMQDVKNLSSIAGMNAITSLEGLIDKYPDLISKFTETEWQGTLYKGERYAVPASWRSFDNTMAYLTVREDVMKKVGYDKFPGDDIDKFIDMAKKSQESILDETGIKAYNWFHQNQDTAHWLHRTYDTYPFYVENSLGVVIARQDGTIDSFYESEEFKKDAQTYFKLYQEGLINPDILNLESQVKYDQAELGAFLPSQTFDPNTSVAIKNKTGIETKVTTHRMADEKPDMIYTFVQNLNAISSTSNDPESGLKLLNWIYEKKENHDLFHYGVEGVHYKAVGDNRLEYIKGDDDKPLFILDTWMTGYAPFVRYESTAPDEHIEHMTYRSDNFVVSPIAGFIFDATNVAAELTNLQTEIIASIYPIKVGMVSYEENIDEAIKKLKAAGLDKYLEEYRKQFKAYLEANPQVLEMAKPNKE